MNIETLNRFMDKVRDINCVRFGAFGDTSGRRSIHLNEQYATDKFRPNFILSPDMVLNPKVDVLKLEDSVNSVVMNKRVVSLYGEAHQPFGATNAIAKANWLDDHDQASLRIEVDQFIQTEDDEIKNIRGHISFLFEGIINHEDDAVIELITHFKHLSGVYHTEKVRYPIEYAKYVKLLGNLFVNVRVIEVEHGLNRP